jgi:hypothetical protein
MTKEDTGNPHISVTQTFSIEGERLEIEADAQLMTIALAKLTRDTSRNVRKCRDDTTRLRLNHQRLNCTPATIPRTNKETVASIHSGDSDSLAADTPSRHLLAHVCRH